MAIDPQTSALLAQRDQEFARREREADEKQKSASWQSAAIQAFAPAAIEDENDPEFMKQIAALREGQAEASAPYEQYLSEELNRLAMASGRASGAELASQQGVGLTGFSPINRLQAQQGEVFAEQAAGGIRREQAMHPMQRFAEQQQAARGDIESILANYSGAKARSSRIARLGQAHAGTPQGALYGTQR